MNDRTATTVTAALLFGAARFRPAGWVVGNGLRWFACSMPLDRLLCTRRIVAFRHPRPLYEHHVLIVPRWRVGSLLDLAKKKQSRRLVDVFVAARRIISEYALPVDEYTLIVNGGPRQEVAQLHFHLFAGEPVVTPFSDSAAYPIADVPPGGMVVAHPDGDWSTHLLLTDPTLEPLSRFDSRQAGQVTWILNAVAGLNGRFKLQERGYALVFQERSDTERDRLVIHLIAGRRCFSSGS